MKESSTSSQILLPIHSRDEPGEVKARELSCQHPLETTNTARPLSSAPSSSAERVRGRPSNGSWISPFPCSKRASTAKPPARRSTIQGKGAVPASSRLTSSGPFFALRSSRFAARNRSSALAGPLSPSSCLSCSGCAGLPWRRARTARLKRPLSTLCEDSSAVLASAADIKSRLLPHRPVLVRNYSGENDSQFATAVRMKCGSSTPCDYRSVHQHSSRSFGLRTHYSAAQRRFESGFLAASA